MFANVPAATNSTLMKASVFGSRGSRGRSVVDYQGLDPEVLRAAVALGFAPEDAADCKVCGAKIVALETRPGIEAFGQTFVPKTVVCANGCRREVW